MKLRRKYTQPKPQPSQIDLLAAFLQEHYPDEIGKGYPDGTNTGSEGAADVAIRLLHPEGYGLAAFLDSPFRYMQNKRYVETAESAAAWAEWCGIGPSPAVEFVRDDHWGPAGPFPATSE